MSKDWKDAVGESEAVREMPWREYLAAKAEFEALPVKVFVQPVYVCVSCPNYRTPRHAGGHDRCNMLPNNRFELSVYQHIQPWCPLQDCPKALLKKKE